jgi:dTDP-4-amino-4,6-dideoxygalactose transaminase
LEQAQRITAERISIWCRYHDMLVGLEQEGLLRRPAVPAECSHNGHLYYVLLAPEIDRQKVLDEFEKNKIGATFHYVPLHSSPAGMRYGRAHGDLEFTDSLSQRLVRLPLWMGLTQVQQEKVCGVLRHALRIAR